MFAFLIFNVKNIDNSTVTMDFNNDSTIEYLNCNNIYQ